MRLGDLRCSQAVRTIGEEPIGTAIPTTSFVLVDWPLPWPSDITELADLAAVEQTIADAGGPGRWRLQATVPDDDMLAAGTRRIVWYRLPDGAFDRYRRTEEIVDAADLIDVIRLGISGGAPRPHAPTPTAAELLICTHGKRDACCGSFGTRLWRELVDGGADDRPGLRIVRTSHTGGHRFAPTALYLPTGTMWAWLDTELVDRILDRRGDVATVAPHYRGSCAIGPAPAQVVERALFEQHGWAWLDHPRRGRVLDSDSRMSTVEVAHDDPNAGLRTWRADVATIGATPVPPCGDTLSKATKQTPLLTIVPGSLREVPSTVT